MEATTFEIEKRLNKIVSIATKLQFLLIIAFCLILLTRNLIASHKSSYDYKLVAEQFSLFAFLSSVVVSRIYIYTGKKLELCKQFSPDEKKARRNEYFAKFLWPYLFWIACFGIFSWL
jgi:hypothetical protein